MGGDGALVSPLHDYIYLHLLPFLLFFSRRPDGMTTKRRNDGGKKPFGHFYLDWDAQRSGMGHKCPCVVFLMGFGRGFGALFVSWGCVRGMILLNYLFIFFIVMREIWGWMQSDTARRP